jgi:LysM repeat protein
MGHNPLRLPLFPRLTRPFFVFARRWGFALARTAWLCIAVLLLTNCGQVVTVETPTVAPTAEPTGAISLSTVPPRPTVTRTLPTAAPPNTPTVSPTPIIHVVQSGETLIAIALQYGVTVAALQSANGISDPSALQVSQELIIPTGVESQGPSLEPLVPTPTPMAFAVEGMTCYDEPVGSLWCLGEVVNSTPASIENVQLRVTLHNAAGEELIGGDVFAALDLIPSGQRAPFGIRFASPPQSFDGFWARPIRAEASSEPANRYAVLEVAAVEAGPVGSLFEVKGSVINPGQQAVTGVMVVVTTYDAEGNVTGYRQSRLPDELAAGASADFAISLMPNGDLPASYTVAVQGRLGSP